MTNSTKCNQCQATFKNSREFDQHKCHNLYKNVTVRNTFVGQINEFVDGFKFHTPIPHLQHLNSIEPEPFMDISDRLTARWYLTVQFEN